MNTTPSAPSEPDQPSWGSAPSTSPTGSGTDSVSDSGNHSGSDEPHRQQPGPARPGAQFFDAVRGLGVIRPDDGRVAAGVAAGLARRWNVDPVAVRVGFVLLALLGGLGVTLYGLGWLLLPQPDGRIHAQQVLTGTVTAGLVGAVATILLSGPQAHGPLLFLAVIGLIAWRLTARSRQHRYQGC